MAENTLKGNNTNSTPVEMAPISPGIATGKVTPARCPPGDIGNTGSAKAATPSFKDKMSFLADNGEDDSKRMLQNTEAL